MIFIMYGKYAPEDMPYRGIWRKKFYPAFRII